MENIRGIYFDLTSQNLTYMSECLTTRLFLYLFGYDVGGREAASPWYLRNCGFRVVVTITFFTWLLFGWVLTRFIHCEGNYGYRV